MNGFSASTAGTLLTMLDSTAVKRRQPPRIGKAERLHRCDDVRRQQRALGAGDDDEQAGEQDQQRPVESRDRCAPASCDRVSSRKAPPTSAASAGRTPAKNAIASAMQVSARLQHLARMRAAAHDMGIERPTRRANSAR